MEAASAAAEATPTLASRVQTRGGDDGDEGAWMHGGVCGGVVDAPDHALAEPVC